MDMLWPSSMCMCSEGGPELEVGFVGVWKKKSAKENAPLSNTSTLKRRSSFHAAFSNSAKCPACSN